jgi:hypothetical protein
VRPKLANNNFTRTGLRSHLTSNRGSLANEPQGIVPVQILIDSLLSLLEEALKSLDKRRVGIGGHGRMLLTCEGSVLNQLLPVTCCVRLGHLRPEPFMRRLESFIAAQGGIVLLGWRRLAGNDGCPVRGGRGVSGRDARRDARRTRET